MTSTSTSSGWYRAVIVLFAMMGLTNASLLARLPEVRDAVNTTTAGIGFILLGFAIGSLAGLALAGRVIERVGTRRVIVWGFIGAGLAAISQGVSIAFGSPEALFASFVALGVAGAAADVAVNVSGASLEQHRGRTIMPLLHAGFSVGTFVGVGLGAIGTTIEFSLVYQLVTLAIITSGIAVLAARDIREDVAEAAENETSAAPQALWRNPVVILLSLGIFAVTLTEGASNDWLVLAIVDDYDESRTNGAIAYAVLMVAMIVTRLIGGQISDRLGRHRTLQLFALLGAVGIVLVILGGNLVLAFIGAALWGAGVALGFPLFLSAAGEGKNAARRVSFVASSGYMAFLVGPPVLGIVAQNIGLLTMMWILVVAILGAVVFARGAKPSPAET